MVVYKYHKTIIGKAASDNMRGKMNDTMTGKDITKPIKSGGRAISMGNAYEITCWEKIVHGPMPGQQLPCQQKIIRNSYGLPIIK